MEITLQLNKDFERTLEDLKKKYGEDFEILNGIHSSQLDFSEFINKFVDEKAMADATIDPNANARHKDIRSFMTEKGKSEDKLFALNKIFVEIKKKWGLKTAKQWLEQEFSKGLYLNDASTSSYFPYCFTGGTKILTDKGVKSLGSLVGQQIKVLNKNRGWENATVEHFGKSPVKEITLVRCGEQRKFTVTGNHRWFTDINGKLGIKTTDELIPGDKIPLVTSHTWGSVKPSPFGVAHGFYTGDGDKGKHMRANFCGEKIALLPYFTPAEVSGDEKEYTTQGIPKTFLDLPSLEESASYLYGWLSGYFAADGYIDSQGRCSISSSKAEYLEFVNDVLCVLGMPTHMVRCQERISNLTGEPGKIYTISLSSEYLKEDFFIKPSHKERFERNRDKSRKPNRWTVKEISDAIGIEDVYCAVVEGTQSFALEGNVLTHNCWANDLTRLATEGLFFLDDYNNEPPRHLTTYFDDVIEFVSFLSNRQSGAVGLPNVIIWAYYFWKKDCESGDCPGTPEKYLRQNFQKFIYRLNQPFLRIDQAAFTNVSIFDRPYLENLFGGVVFPDGTMAIDCTEELIKCEKIFMDVVAETRKTNMFTFPVLTYSLYYKDGKFQDEEFARWASTHNMEWSDSNFFVSDNIGILSNCPLAPDTKILYWSDRYRQFKVSPINILYNNMRQHGQNTVKVLSNGKQIECRVNRFEVTSEYDIELVNGSHIKTTANHLNKVYGKDYVKTENLTEEDYLPISLTPYEGSDSMCYEDGRVIGMFLGDGSYRNNHEVCFSLNRDSKKEALDFITEYCSKRYNASVAFSDCVSEISGKNSCVNVSLNSDCLRGLINQFVIGDSALTKYINPSAFSCSMDFRTGILDGLYETDGGNSNRIYTSSEKLKDSLVTLLATLGIASTVTADTRDGRLGENPCYTVRFYTPEGRTQRKDFYKVDTEYFWVRIKSITKYQPPSPFSYCLEVADEQTEPIFMLANGIVTHNCRLLSDTSKLSGFINSIGGTALSVGSCRVSTVNLVRIAYESGLNRQKYLKILRDRVTLDCKALTSMRHILKRNIEKGLLPNYQDGAVELDKTFCTVGAIGLYETMDMFGLIHEDEFGNKSYSDEAVFFATEILDTINDVKDNFPADFTFNLEMIPAENCAGVICQADNLLFEQHKYEIYSNQWIPLTEKCTIAEKCRLGSLFDMKCGGGCIAHINIESRFANEQMAWDMLNFVAKSGVMYFAFTTKINVCKENHAFIGTSTCPVCGGTVADQYARVVGYYSRTSGYQRIRRKEFDRRKWYDVMSKESIM